MPTVDWPYLRIWADSGGTETIYQGAADELRDAGRQLHARDGAVRVAGHGDSGGLHRTRLAGSALQLPDCRRRHAGQRGQRAGGDDHGESGDRAGERHVQRNANYADLPGTGMRPGSNGNRIGVYGTVHGAGTESWTARRRWGLFDGGVSPADLAGEPEFQQPDGCQRRHTVPTNNVRKLRWTWAADLADLAILREASSRWRWQLDRQRNEAAVYSVAGPGSRRIEDDDLAVSYQGTWSRGAGATTRADRFIGRRRRDRRSSAVTRWPAHTRCTWGHG